MGDITKKTFWSFFWTQCSIYIRGFGQCAILAGRPIIVTFCLLVR